MIDEKNKTDSSNSDVPQKLKLGPEIPDKVLRMWYVEDKKNNYQVKKVCELKSAKAITGWDAKINIIKNSVGAEIKVYPTFAEAAEIAILRKINDRKKKWEAYVNASYVLNAEIGELYDSLNKLQNKDEFNEEK